MKYIDTEKLITAIEERLKNIHDYINGAGMKYHGPKFYKARGKESAYDALLSIVYFLQQEQPEQPEVDLEKALDEYYKNAGFGPSEAIEYEIHKDIARHFYELGRIRKEDTK